MSATFAHVARGTRSVKRVQISLLSGITVAVGVRVLSGGDDDAIETHARAAAKARGVDDPKVGNSIYDRWVQVYTLLFGVLSVPEKEEDPVPDPHVQFFASAEEIIEGLDSERIAYLYAMQTQWQALVSPRPKHMTPDEFAFAVFKHAMGGTSVDELPFFAWHPDLQAAYLITSADLLMNSPLLRSRFGSPSGQSATSSSLNGSRDESGVNQDFDLELNQRLADVQQRFSSVKAHAVELPEHEALRKRGAGIAPPPGFAPRKPAAKNAAKRTRRAQKGKR